jgi:CheY-like chemotaxis protein
MNAVEEKVVLVIEDNALNMKLIRSLLNIARLQIMEASDAESGLSLARERLPSLVLMDIQLPGMDGLAATAMMKKDPLMRDIPVIALTSHAMQGDEERALESGCSGYIAKPIDIDAFLETIRRAMS